MLSAKKDFEAARLGVFATSDLPLTHFNCGIRIQQGYAYRIKVSDPNESRSALRTRSADNKLTAGSWRIRIMDTNPKDLTAECFNWGSNSRLPVVSPAEPPIEAFGNDRF